MKLKRLLSLLVLLAVVVTGAWGQWPPGYVQLDDIQAEDLEDDGVTFIVRDGTTLTGFLKQPYCIQIEPDATVTLFLVEIENNEWAGLACLGDATIILDGVNTVKGGGRDDYPGIYVPEGSTLIIQGGPEGTGQLFASSSSCGAGIGGGYSVNCGDIEIQDGIITATGGSNSAGIGSGGEAECGTITIFGGEVTAKSDENGAGIGSGGEGGSCGDIIINGGIITATGGCNSAGIGTGHNGSCGDIIINGGVIEATGGSNSAGIGTGESGECGDITITTDVISLRAKKGTNAISSIGIAENENSSCGTVIISGTVYPNGITTSPFTNYTVWSSLTITQGDGTKTFSYVEGETWDQAITYHSTENAGWSIMGGDIVYNGHFLYSDAEGNDKVWQYFKINSSTSYYLFVSAAAQWDGDLSKLSNTDKVTVTDGMTLTGSLRDGIKAMISIAAGAEVTLDGVTINGENHEDYLWAGLTCLGNATIILKDETNNSVKGFYKDYPGIYVPVGSTLTIKGTGSLTASSNGRAAGIGGGYYGSCGTITIGEGLIDCTAGTKRVIANGITDDVSNAMKGQTVDISYSRTYITGSGKGKASTLCLPFAFEAKASDGTYATFSKVTEKDGEYEVEMQELADGATVSAGTPYMFLPSGSDKLTQGNSSYTVPGEGFTAASSATNSGWQFIGTYEKKTWPSGQKNLYGFAGKEYYLSNGSQIASDDIGSFRRFDYGTCAAFRCYLLAPESSGARGMSKAGSLPETLKVRLVKADGTTTAIGTLDTRTGEIEFGNDWYDLNGRRLNGQPTQKGVYIHNGHKVAIK